MGAEITADEKKNQKKNRILFEKWKSSCYESNLSTYESGLCSLIIILEDIM